jgi:N-acetyl-anhydromuramyl-L-alanine amidase AmpD
MSQNRWALCLFVLAAACRAPAPGHAVPPESSTWVPAANDAIVVAGRRFHVGVPVVLWSEAPHYDAYSRAPRFAASGESPGADELRYQPGRIERAPQALAEIPDSDSVVEDASAGASAGAGAGPRERVLVAPFSEDLRALRKVVDQFVLHYDVCGVSQSCFRVLQDDRHLSVHFLLDIDGTIYQTLDARETAWHATKSNPRSIGVEIANLGAYPLGEAKPLDTWYARDPGGPYVKLPARLEGGGVRTPGFVGRPARPDRIVGEIQGESLQQFDFTPEQYASLVRLTAALCHAFPRIEPDAPRGADGNVLDHALSDAEWRDFSGILGHYHVQKNKADPGPAFDWERFLADVRERLAATAPRS